MKERKTSVKSKANEMKIKAWKILCRKAFEGDSDISALKAIIELAEPGVDETND